MGRHNYTGERSRLAPLSELGGQVVDELSSGPAAAAVLPGDPLQGAPRQLFGRDGKLALAGQAADDVEIAGLIWRHEEEPQAKAVRQGKLLLNRVQRMNLGLARRVVIREPLDDQMAPIRGRIDDNILRTSLEAALKTLSDARTVVGTRLESAQSAADRAAQAKVTLTSRLTEITGADLAEAITSLSNDRASEQMVLQTGARIGQRSLFDFLG